MLWFNNAIWYRFEPDAGFNIETLEAALDEHPFIRCNVHDQRRSGFAPVADGLTNQRVIAANGALLIRHVVEEKILPPAVVNDALKQKVAEIERSECRKVYRKERNQLKDDIILQLLPRAFTRQHDTLALIMPACDLLVVNENSPAKAEDLRRALRDALGSLKVRLPETKQTPAIVISNWLQQQESLPRGVEIGDSAELCNQLDDKGQIKAKGQDLFSPEIRAHLEGGMQVSRLALTFDDRIRFTLHDDLTLHSLKRTDQYQEKLDDQTPEEELAAIDSDIALLGPEFNGLTHAIIDWFGGAPEVTND